MKNTLWTICKILFIGLSIFAFTPIVMPQGQATPELFGLPRTLWIGLLISISFIALTALGALFIDKPQNQQK